MWVASFSLCFASFRYTLPYYECWVINPKQIEHHTSARNRLVRNIQNMLEKYWATLSTS
jgi:hypothetical protein